MDLYYLNFNNYYNRQVKRFDTLAEYLPFLLDTPEANRNFNPANDITINFIANRTRVNVGDYFLAVENGEIKSRWFILNGNRTRQGQYSVTARRDVIADYYSQTISSPCFIEKAKLNSGDPMIFNKEDMTVNQIKTSEKLLKDRTGCPWIVGYIPRDSFSSSTQISAQALTSTIPADIEYLTLNDFPLKDYMGEGVYIGQAHSIELWTYVCLYAPGPVYYDYTRKIFLGTGIEVEEKYQRATFDNSGYISGYGNPNVYLNYTQTIRDHILADIHALSNHDVQNPTNISDINFNAYNGKTVKIGNDYFNISIVELGTQEINYNLTTNSPLGQYVISTMPSWLGGSPNNNTFHVNYLETYYTVQLTQVFSTISTTIDGNRNALEDAPYDMFCMPYSDDFVVKNQGADYFTSNKYVAMAMATAIALKLPNEKIYDLQLLPYCPLQNYITANGDFDIYGKSYDNILDSNNNVVGVVLWCNKSSFTFDIVNEIAMPTDPIDLKVMNQCDLYRLVSPNYNGQFDFNVAMNGGMSKFNVDCTYKPFSPYIHINPDFNLLYGSDFNDARGLICGGDFSLPQMSSAWESYQMQNKNYLNIFDRQIQNMETNYYYQNMSQLISGSINALGTGISTGVLAGAGFGVASGVTSTAGMLTDYYINKQVQNEAIDYTTDLFGYNLGNIQAIPQSLSKVTAFNENNKLFPFLEYYTCTQKERDAFKNKIRWNGMTVMRMDEIQNFIREEETYIKGKIIRLLDVDEPTNVLNEIANEINKGVYI